MQNSTLGMAIAILIIALVLYLIIKEWLSEWKGKLVDKKEVYESDEDGYTQKKRKLIFETEEGKTKMSVVSKKVYKNAVVGDTYFKNKRSFKPKRAE